ncbi:endolytic transglycosylase MltG [Thalassorhabdus alkalitolerans]|uniref:Endolytic murein transglycosylase n=2 Tax=Bacillaceae TaxID=186817 RepID=A0ABW0YM11_9BACI
MRDIDKEEVEKSMTKRAKQARIIRKIVMISLLVIVIAIAGILAGGYMYVQSAIGPQEEEAEGQIVEIPIGSSTAQIGEILEEENIIQNGTFFRYYVRYQNEGGFQAGEYELSRAMDLDEIIEELKEGRIDEEPEIIFTIPEGYWLESIVETVAEYTPHEVEDIMDVIQDQEYVEGLIDRYDILTDDILDEEIRYAFEGYFFPSRYDFYEEDPSIEEVVELMLDRTEDVLGDYEEQMADTNLTIHELLTLSSIVEREAQQDEDRPLIAGVLFNRLDEDMRLQVDPTVSYALGEHQYMTTFDHTAEDSPYNTYMYGGLPPSPIASPGRDSIEAVLNPEDSSYLYFYARYNGEVIYNETYEEHNRVHQEYRHEWVEGGGDQEEEAE